MYIGETGRSLSKRLKEHKADVRKNKMFSAVANHVNSELHEMDFSSAKIVYPCRDRSKRRIVESSLIICNTNCLNFNKGFCPLNTMVCNAVCQSLDLKL